ncbi:F-box only protein 32 isoform X1 [Frankliniella occidentalis]|uniref:F-box only protein 32 isoform X1 n=1 Tax=Frankliniella occidentalis TaxID=133901 RepID=A0A6J1S5J5_FRAOC|nr:F-box only protein 32 isoform X1 [Frankliniella occidentalis]
MPFISKDWRSPGEEWVKTEEGWEKKKVLECGRQILGPPTENLESRCRGITNYSTDVPFRDGLSKNCSMDEDEKENMQVEDQSTAIFMDGNNRVDLKVVVNRTNSQDGTIQPHCHITVKCTREIAGFNGLSDALKRLDFRSAVHDGRRFHYICKLLDLLITQKLSMLSGCAQKVLFAMLEEVAYQVSASQQNMHMLRKLLTELRAMIDCACWGRPLGSTRLWEQHLQSIDRILSIANTIQIREPHDDMYPKLQNLPEECVREILLRLADHKDVENSSKAYSVMQNLSSEQRIWRELCSFHFTDAQINFVLENIRKQDEQLHEKQQPLDLIGHLTRDIHDTTPHQETGTSQEIETVENPPDWKKVYHKLRKCYGLREDYPEMIQLCRNCCCLFWKSIGHPCIADQDPTFQEKLDTVDKSSLHVPVPPHAFLKFFSL